MYVCMYVRKFCYPFDSLWDGCIEKKPCGLWVNQYGSLDQTLIAITLNLRIPISSLLPRGCDSNW